jgi:hypothetical protein
MIGHANLLLTVHAECEASLKKTIRLFAPKSLVTSTIPQICASHLNSGALLLNLSSADRIWLLITAREMRLSMAAFDHVPHGRLLETNSYV